MRPSKVHSFQPGAAVKPLVFTGFDAADVRDLRLLGIQLPDGVANDMAAALFAGDAAPDVAPTQFAASMGVPMQFLQTFLPGFVMAMTAPRNIDLILGAGTVGDFADEEIVQGVLEPTGLAVPYTDYGNVPFASWNPGFERRSVVRFEQGLRVGKLEELQSAKAKINSAETKRGAANMSLEIVRNRVGFYGFYGGANRTYGFLNDPSLPAYVTVANGASGSPLWSSKTFLEITADIRAAVGALILQSNGLITAGPNAQNATAMTLVLPIGADNYFGVTSVYGNSVADWVNKTYPKMRVISAPEMTNANGGVSAFYLFADSVQDGQSTDGGQTWMPLTVTKSLFLGIENKVKSYVEDFANATAGALLKRPWAVVRRSGI